MTGSSPLTGYVLTATDSNGDATWSSTGSALGWTTNGTSLYNTNSGNVGINTTNGANVGIGTTNPQGGLIVMNGNVGIGTWVPGTALNVNGNTILGTSQAGASILSSGTGSFAGGYVQFNSGLSVIQSSGQGSFAFGEANEPGPVTLAATGTGAIAMGFSQGTLQATGAGSVAIGENVQANANNSLAFGLSVINPSANTFMVGFNTTPTLTVTSTNVGIGTLNPFGGKLIVASGNVGIGSLTPGQMLDVQGTVRVKGLTMTGSSPVTGYVLTATDSSGDATWSSSGSVGTNYWLNTAASGNVGISTTNTVGIGTTSAGAGAGLLVMNGNVGIGTWAPTAALYVEGASILGVTSNNASIVSTGTGAVATGYANWAGGPAASITASGNGSFATGEAVSTGSAGAITSSSTGSFAAGESLGTLTSSGAGSVAMGYASSGGILQATSTGSIAMGDTVQATAADALAFGKSVVNSYTNSFMVGFNSTPTLTVTSSNVGIGTFNPFGGKLIVASGNVGIGSLTPGQMLDVQGTMRSIGFAMTGSSPLTGYVLTATDSSGDVTWSSSGSVGTNYWLNTAASGNVGISTTNTVGIGTTSAGLGAGLLVMNGNVGIGTWAPDSAFEVKGSGAGIMELYNNTGVSKMVVDLTGNIGIGTFAPNSFLDVAGSGSFGADMRGSVRLQVV